MPFTAAPSGTSSCRLLDEARARRPPVPGTRDHARGTGTPGSQPAWPGAGGLALDAAHLGPRRADLATDKPRSVSTPRVNFQAQSDDAQVHLTVGASPVMLHAGQVRAA